ncbi:MAG: hypothetical protein IJ764_00755 [Bacteroidales bacterium]|nr:hypothetical protein [Bacteroidales bacterium]
MQSQTYNGYDKFLVGFTVFMTFWNFFTGFKFAFGGILWLATGGKINLVFIYTFVLVAAGLLMLNPRSFSSSNVRFAIPYAASYLIVYFINYARLSNFDNNLIIAIINGCIFILLRDDLKARCFDIFVRSLAVILLLSSIEYIIYFITGWGIRLFHFVERDAPTGVQVFDQFLLNLISITGDTYRFQCLCEEPGVVGTLCGFLIFVLRPLRRYRFQYAVILTTGLLTFSMAYYVLLSIHILTSGIKIRTILLILILSAITYVVFQDFFDKLILERIVTHRVDNRVTETFSLRFTQSLYGGDLFFGKGEIGVMDQGSGGNAGMMVWIWKYGIFGLAMVFSVYAYYYFQKVRRYRSDPFLSLLFFAIFWGSFYQREYISNLDYIIVYFNAPILLGHITSTSESTGCKASSRPPQLPCA